MGETSVIINDEDNNDDDDDDEDDENDTVVIYDPALNYSQERVTQLLMTWLLTCWLFCFSCNVAVRKTLAGS